MNKKNIKMLALALGCCIAASAQAGIIVNPQFDNPIDYFSGWTKANTTYTFLSTSSPTDLAKSVTSSPASTSGFVYHPPVGNRFLELKAGENAAWVTVSQSVSLVQGQIISGFAALNGYDNYSPVTGKYNDTAAVWVLSGSQIIPIWQKSMSDVGSQGHSDWFNWSFTAPDATTHNYELFFGVMNVGDTTQTQGKYASRGLFTVVPEPSTWVAGGAAGLMLVFSSFRQRRIA